MGWCTRDGLSYIRIQERVGKLVLTDVQVFDNASGRHLYDVPRLYVSRDQHEVSVEIMETKPEEADGSQERRNTPA